jgi:hypothetical protein
LAREPREEDRKDIDRLRQLLISQLDILDARRHEATAGGFGLGPSMPLNDFIEFDDVDADINPDTRGMTGGASDATEPQVIFPECRQLSMPSTWLSPDNTYRPIELKLRIEQASETLQALRDAIADKSFHYSHVIRVAPRKGVRTRARGIIAKLNDTMAYLCQVYGRCRSALVKLEAGNEVLDRFKILLKDHIKSSTALLNPNEPGSTSLRLSWIWQMGQGGDRSTPDGLRECK